MTVQIKCSNYYTYTCDTNKNIHWMCECDASESGMRFCSRAKKVQWEMQKKREKEKNTIKKLLTKIHVKCGKWLNRDKTGISQRIETKEKWFNNGLIAKILWDMQNLQLLLLLSSRVSTILLVLYANECFTKIKFYK